MLNWRRDPGYEQREMLHKLRMKQLESEIQQIEKETEQLRQETARLRQLNAREKALSALIRQRCFPPECSSPPPQPTSSDCESSWS